MPRLDPRTLGTAAALLTVAVAAAAQPPTASPTRSIGLDDLVKMREVRDARPSPDGRWVAYVVSRADAEKDKRDSDVWMVSWDGREQVRLTSSPDSETAPRWSPDGRSLAFLASRGDDDQKKKGAQVWLLNRAGGEAERLTDLKGGVSEFEWSPDSRRLVLVASDPDPDDEPEAKEGWKRKTKPPIVIDRYHFKRDRDGYLRGQYSHLHLFDVASRKAEPLTTGPHDDSAPAWSPDGTAIAFVSKRGPDPDRDVDSNIFVVEARSGAEPRQLTTHPGADGGRPAWSPDGRLIAYLQGDVKRYTAYDQEQLAVVPASGGMARVLTAALDRSVSSPAWASDGRSILCIVEDDRTAYVARVPAAGGSIEKLTSGPRVVSGLMGAGEAWAVTASTAGEPFEVHALEPSGLRRLSRQNDDWTTGLRLAVTEGVSFAAKDGTVVNGLVTRPANHVPGRRYPTIVYIHGGPDGQDDYSFDFERELLAAHGYVVLQVNYRGGSGRGSAYQKAIFADWGHLEVVDLLAGVDHLVAQGVADPERLGIGGWSYGGILTNYTIATDGRFKAAISGASSSLQSSLYGVDQYIVQWENELGPPWKHPDVYQKVSYPFWHADRIRTPTLFLCGERDFNVPVAGVEQMYQALRSLGVDTQLVIYPGQFHGLTTPSYRRDRLERYLAWFDRYLQPSAEKTSADGEGIPR